VVAAYLPLRSAGLSGAVRLRHFGQRLWAVRAVCGFLRTE
jgi:hypothetical protein